MVHCLSFRIFGELNLEKQTKCFKEKKFWLQSKVNLFQFLSKKHLFLEAKITTSNSSTNSFFVCFEKHKKLVFLRPKLLKRDSTALLNKKKATFKLFFDWSWRNFGLQRKFLKTTLVFFSDNIIFNLHTISFHFEYFSVDIGFDCTIKRAVQLGCKKKVRKT